MPAILATDQDGGPGLRPSIVGTTPAIEACRTVRTRWAQGTPIAMNRDWEPDPPYATCFYGLVRLL